MSFPNLLFFVLLLFIFFIIGFQDIILLRPQSIHQWAQCDRASVALNFANETFNIFKPRVHNIANGTGITGMEFPIINYIVGMIYRLFGFHEAIYRILICLILSLGLIAAGNLAYEYLNDIFFAISAVLLVFLSPVLVYYTPNFLPDTAGLGFVLCGWYYFSKFLKEHHVKYVFAVLIFVSLAGLIKITYVISIAAMLILGINKYRNYLKTSDKMSISKIRKVIVALIVSVLLVLLWYWYAAYLNRTYNSNIFLLEYRSIDSFGQFISILHEIKSLWFGHYFSIYMHFFIFISMIIVLTYGKLVDPFVFKSTILLWTGNLIYFLFMISQFRQHDYYIIPMLPAIIFQLIAFLTIIKIFIHNRKIRLIYSKIFLGIFIIHSTWFAKHIFYDRYDPRSWMKSDPVYTHYYDITPYIRSIGIGPGGKVLSIFDFSPEITLYLMDAKGLTASKNVNLNEITTIYKNQFNYLAINDTTVLNNAAIMKLNPKLLGTKNNIYFYEISK